jgi:hypothetical protein
VFEPDLALIGQVAAKLEADFRSAHGSARPEYAEALVSIARRTLEKIALCDALYHNVNHTILVTLVGNDILKGKLAIGVELPAKRWLNFIVSLLCHDIGYVPDLCQGDRNGVLASGKAGGTFTLPVEATHASMAPYHVDRGVLFVRERFTEHPLLDADAIAANIDRTRFPVPEDEVSQATEDDPGLLRAADLLGQVGEPRVARRYPALFYEFEETGVNRKLGYSSPHDLVRDFPRFYSKVVVRYCREAMRLLEATADGQMWLSNLHFHLAATGNLESDS